MNDSVTLLNPPIEAVPADERPPDIAHVAAIAAVGDWPRRSLPHLLGERSAEFQVVFAQSALDGIHLHGQSAPDIEVCGVLVGHGCRDDAGEPYLLISHVIRGSAAASRSTNVTFTADTWLHIQTVMDAQHAGETIVGWYHTHPSFGIFLSEMDVFICQHFFNLAWQCAFVYDPQSGEEGNFAWRGGVPTREPVLIEDDVTPQSARIPLIATADAMTGDPDSPTEASPPAVGKALPAPSDGAVNPERFLELLHRVDRLERRQRLLVTALAFVAAFGVMWAVLFAPTPSLTPASQPATAAKAAPSNGPTGPGPASRPRSTARPIPFPQLPEVIRPS